MVSLFVLHHLVQWEEAIADARCVLQPGDVILTADLLPPFVVPPIGWLFPPDLPVDRATRGARTRRFVRVRIHRVGPFAYRLMAQTAKEDPPAIGRERRAMPEATT